MGQHLRAAQRAECNADEHDVYEVPARQVLLHRDREEGVRYELEGGGDGCTESVGESVWSRPVYVGGHCKTKGRTRCVHTGGRRESYAMSQKDSSVWLKSAMHTSRVKWSRSEGTTSEFTGEDVFCCAGSKGSVYVGG
jgi:hypothetical protein